MPEKIRVMIVDDHHVVRQGLAALLRASDSVDVVAEAADGREAIQRFSAHAPDVTLMDLQMQPVVSRRFSAFAPSIQPHASLC